MINKNYLQKKPFIYNLSEAVTTMLYGYNAKYDQNWSLHNNTSIDSLDVLFILTDTTPFTMLQVQILQAILIKYSIVNKSQFKNAKTLKVLEERKEELYKGYSNAGLKEASEITKEISKLDTKEKDNTFSITVKEICDFMNVEVTRENRFDTVVKRNLLEMTTKCFYIEQYGIFINFNTVLNITKTEINITIPKSLDYIANQDKNHRTNPIMLIHLNSKYSNLLAEYMQRHVQQTTTKHDTFHVWQWHYRGVQLDSILELFGLADTPKSRRVIKKAFNDIKEYCDEKKLCFPKYVLNAKTKMYEITDYCYPSDEVLNNLNDEELKVMGIRKEILAKNTIDLWSA